MFCKAIANVFFLLAASAVLAHRQNFSRSKNQATKVLAKREDPSPYPGNFPCTNEPSYLGFNYTNANDAKKMDSIHNAFCYDVGELMANAVVAIRDTDTTVFGRFFDADPASGFPGIIVEVYLVMWNTGNGGQIGNAMPVLGTFIFDNSDFNGWCPETGSNNPLPGDGESSATDGAIVGGYTSTDVNDNREKIHFCDSAFSYPALKDIACAELSLYPDYKMESLSRIMLHELTHYTIIGLTAGTNQIDDVTNIDNLTAYGASRSHALVDIFQDDIPVDAMINADNYAWLAANAYFKDFCKGSDAPPPDNGNFYDPPDYVYGQPGG